MAEVDKYQFANEFGFIRKEIVVSTADIRNLDRSASGHASHNVQYAKLRLAHSLSGSEEPDTVALAEVHSEGQLKISKGSRILEIAVHDKTNGKLDNNLSFLLGYLPVDLSLDPKKQASLAQRAAGINNPLTGAFLNAAHAVHIPQGLNAASLSGLCSSDKETVTFHETSGSVGEPFDVLPAITVLAGSADVGQLEFVVQYVPSC